MMLEQEYQLVQVGTVCQVTVNGKDHGKRATLVKLRRNQDSPHGGPVKILFDDGKERWISHRFLAIFKESPDQEGDMVRELNPGDYIITEDEVRPFPIDNDSLRKIVGHNLWFERSRRKMTIAELSELSGVSARQIQRIEACDPDNLFYDDSYALTPSLKTIVKLANSLHIWLKALLGDM